MNKKIILMLLIVASSLSKNILASQIGNDYVAALQAEARTFTVPLSGAGWNATVDAQSASILANAKLNSNFMPSSVRGLYMNAAGAQANVNKAFMTGNFGALPSAYGNQLKAQWNFEWGLLKSAGQAVSGAAKAHPLIAAGVIVAIAGPVVLYGGYALGKSYIVPALTVGAKYLPRKIAGEPTHFCECKDGKTTGGINCNRWCIKSGWTKKQSRQSDKGIVCICDDGSEEEVSCTSLFPPRCWYSGWTGKVFDKKGSN